MSLTFLLLSLSAQAEDRSPLFQFHGRIGLVNMEYTGPLVGQGSFSIPSAIDLQAEYFARADRSYIVRSDLGIDQLTGVVRTAYSGFGQRIYFGGSGVSNDASEIGTAISSQPRWRLYAGWDAGISEVLVVSLNQVLGTYATTGDVSVCGGAIYQLSKDVGIEAQIDYGTGMGFSNITVTTTTNRMLLGLTIYY